MSDETIHIQIKEKRLITIGERVFLVACLLFGSAVGYGLTYLYDLCAGLLAEFSHSLK